MSVLDLAALSTWAVFGIFAAAAVAVWVAGTHLSHRADAIAERTGLGKAIVGALLLGGITSLPEAAATVTAAAAGNAALAVNNLFGGVALQVAILVIADAVAGPRALTSLVERPVVFLQGMMLVLVLATPAAGIVAGSVTVAGVGMWSVATAVLAVIALWVVKRYESSEVWQVQGVDERTADRDDRADEPTPARRARRRRERLHATGTARLGWQIAGLAVVVLVAGVALARSSEVIAERTGLGSSFVGAVFLALATSLPEVSTTVAAVRLGEYRLAMSNIFGTNLIDVAFVLLADIAFRQGAVLDEVGDFSVFGALLGIAVTAVYVVGLAIRDQRTVLRMGVDSIVVAVLYVGGVAVLYTMR